MRQTVLITGGTGMVGRELLPKLCSDEAVENVIVLTRGTTQSVLNSKIQVLHGDVCKPDLGLEEACRQSIARRNGPKHCPNQQHSDGAANRVEYVPHMPIERHLLHRVRNLIVCQIG